MTGQANRRLALKLAGVAIGMFGFGYALAPMYALVCAYTGVGGKTGVVSATEAEALKVNRGRNVVVEFDTNTNGALPWSFAALQHQVTVHPGQLTEVYFVVENTADHTVIGQAVPSVAPAKAAPYFNKTECFCFTQQRLAAGERRKMPVRFVVGTELPAGVTTVTLSYTFFEAPGAVAEIAPTARDKQGS